MKGQSVDTTCSREEEESLTIRLLRSELISSPLLCLPPHVILSSPLPQSSSVLSSSRGIRDDSFSQSTQDSTSTSSVSSSIFSDDPRCLLRWVVSSASYNDDGRSSLSWLSVALGRESGWRGGEGDVDGRRRIGASSRSRSLRIDDPLDVVGGG